MRTIPLFLALAIASCAPILEDPLLRTGMTKKQIDEVPPNEVKAGIVNDARTWRRLRDRLDEGTHGSSGITFSETGPRCTADDSEMDLFLFPETSSEAGHRVEEIAYYCRVEKHYLYHYRGGKQDRDVWLGPFPLSRDRQKPPEE